MLQFTCPTSRVGEYVHALEWAASLTEVFRDKTGPNRTTLYLESEELPMAFDGMQLNIKLDGAGYRFIIYTDEDDFERLLGEVQLGNDDP